MSPDLQNCREVIEQGQRNPGSALVSAGSAPSHRCRVVSESQGHLRITSTREGCQIRRSDTVSKLLDIHSVNALNETGNSMDEATLWINYLRSSTWRDGSNDLGPLGLTSTRDWNWYNEVPSICCRRTLSTSIIRKTSTNLKWLSAE